MEREKRKPGYTAIKGKVEEIPRAEISYKRARSHRRLKQRIRELNGEPDEQMETREDEQQAPPPPSPQHQQQRSPSK